MINMKIRKAFPMALCLSLIVSGCGFKGLAHDSTFNSQYENKEESVENIYVSSAHLIYQGHNPDDMTLWFCEIESNETVSMYYDGATVVNDRYANPLSIEQLSCGDVVNIAYNAPTGKVGAIVQDPNSFCFDNITKYSVSENEETFYIGDEAYSISKATKVFSSGEQIDLNQLITHDNLTIQGEGKNILSIRVEDGHGYLKLENEEALVGGWIEVGQTVISQVMEDMLFTVPEGEYTVHLTNDGIDENRQVVIARNNVTTLDIGDIVPTQKEKGVVSFNITPNTSAVYVDGSFVNIAYSVKLPVGIHEITASASGYPTVSEYFDVTGIDQVVELDLTDGQYNAGTVGSLSGNSLNKNLYATITVEAPTGAELYEDNIYKGITPATYQKTPGTHTLTLYKQGYETKSYTVVIDDDGKDQTFSFSEMIPTSSLSGNSLNVPSSSLSSNSLNSNGTGSTVSGNTLSANSLN